MTFTNQSVAARLIRIEVAMTLRDQTNRMPRIGIKFVLYLFALAALWLSTFAGYAGSHDVRKGVLLIVFMSAGYCAVLLRGRRRAFWAGFFIVMLLHAPNLGASFDSSAHWHWFGYVAN